MSTLTIPAAQLGDANDQTAALLWWNWGSSANWTSGMVGQPGLPITREAWSWPIWDAAEAKGRTIRVWRNPAVWDEPARFQSAFVAPAQPVNLPWAATWRTGVGTDQGVIITTGPDTGYAVLNLRPANLFDAIPLLIRSQWQARTGDWVCDGLVRYTPENDGKIEGRGAGKVPKVAGMLTANMAANGVTTALAMVGFNLQYGPGARFVPPATRVEHLTAASLGPTAKILAADPTRLIPEGTRFRLSMTDKQIDEWAAARHPDPAKRATAIIIATGLRDYGWVILETGTGRCQLESEGTLNPVAKATWAMCGMRTDDDFGHLLDGLFAPDRIKVVRAA